MPEEGDPERLAQWLESELESSGDFDRSQDQAAVREHAHLLMAVEGWDVKRYLLCEPGLRRARIRGAKLYAAALAAAGARRNISEVDVYRALSKPMTGEQGLCCASWHPQGHISQPRYLYRARIALSAVAGISVGHELHPIVLAGPGCRWVRVQLLERRAEQ